MKNTLLLVVSFTLLAGCSKSEYDVSAGQIEQRNRSVGKPGPVPGTQALPPGAVKKETRIKKGDKLPDGTIATHDGKLMTVTVGKPPKNGN